MPAAQPSSHPVDGHPLDGHPLDGHSLDGGFTLVELLVVMLIVGVLAAIAVPVFLTQRAKARDTATRADVSRLGKEIAAYFVDGAGPVAISVTGGGATVSDSHGYTSGTIQLTAGTVQPVQDATAGLGSATTWCVALTNQAAGARSFSYSATAGLQEGRC